jgi:hypothetical protein
MATKVSEFVRSRGPDDKAIRRRSRAGKLNFARVKSQTRSKIARAFVQSEQEPDKALQELQIICDTLKTEIARLTADLALTRRRLRAERYRTRRLVDMISNQEQLETRAKKSTPLLGLGESGEALAVLLAQQRFKSQGRLH